LNLAGVNFAELALGRMIDYKRRKGAPFARKWRLWQMNDGGQQEKNAEITDTGAMQRRICVLLLRN